MQGVGRVFLVLAFVAVITIKKASAGKHVVGGSQGWEESADFDSWTSVQTFKVGDQIVFKYTSGLHSVVELENESAYKNCDIGSAVNSLNSGNDVVTLNKPGTRYFACGTIGHCGQGMKVKITTVTGKAPSTPASASSSPTTTSSASALQQSFDACFLLLLLVAAFTTTSLLLQGLNM